MIYESHTITVSVAAVLVMMPFFFVNGQQQEEDDEPKGTVVCNNLNITGLSIVSRPSGAINLLGFIGNNNTSLTYDSVGVIGEFYDSEDKLIGVESSDAQFSSLDPNENSSFKVKTDVSNKTIDHYTAICRSSKGIAK